MRTRVTMEDVAREAGVSRALVSLAYRDAHGVSATTRTRILSIGERLGYTPDLNAARLAQSGSTTLGVYLQDLHNDVFADVFEGLRSEADAAGKELVLSVGSIDGARDAAALATLESARVDVIIAAGLQLDDAAVRAIARRTPVVTVARTVADVDAATTDNANGARLATEHLLRLGHRRIAFLANPQTDGYRDRQAGHEATMREWGAPARVIATTYARAEAATTTSDLLDGAEPPTAIFAHNDQAALGVLDTLVGRGLRPGTDVSVIGYDDSAASRGPGVALTTVNIHAHDLGARAARLAIERMHDSDAERRVEQTEPTLVVRGTTGPPRA